MKTFCTIITLCLLCTLALGAKLKFINTTEHTVKCTVRDGNGEKTYWTIEPYDTQNAGDWGLIGLALVEVTNNKRPYPNVHLDQRDGAAW